jgi:hypothetical protein
MLLIDLLLVYSTWNEGVRYLDLAWRKSPDRLVLWSVLWGTWQIAVLGVLGWDFITGPRAYRMIAAVRSRLSALKERSWYARWKDDTPDL